jgi:hypothetical protein
VTHPTGLLLALVALALAVLSSLVAVTVRYCPESGECSWTPGWGLTAAGVALLGLLAAQRFSAWALRGRGAWQGTALLVATVAFGALWFVAFLASLAETA